MSERHDSGRHAHMPLEIFQPQPDVLYNLETTAHIAGVPRRSVLIYCRAGFVRSIFQPPYGVMAFTEEAIHTIRRIEYVRTRHGMDLALVKTVFELIEEVERLRSELSFLRHH
jgi:hypothetical protein